MTPAEFKNLLNKTELLSKWESSGKCFGHFQVLEKLGSKTKVRDRIYEFYCLLRILEDLAPNYNVEMVNNPKNDQVFPQAPGKKENYSYFKLRLKSKLDSEFQICFGTKIGRSDLPDDFFTPDISFQTASATNHPNELDALLIFDAKYKSNSQGGLDNQDLRAFMQWVRILEVENASIQPIVFADFKDLLSNCLITNGKALVDKDAFCKKYFIRQIGNFDLDVTARVVVG